MRRLFPLLLLLTLGCQPSGCTRPAPPPDGLAITDDLGRTVALASPPQRIVSLSPAATEILFAIGAGPRVVAGTEFDNFPEEAKQMPRIGGFDPRSINVEGILGHRPDLVVAAPQKGVIAALEGFNIPVAALDPKTASDVWGNIELLGRLTGCETKATELADRGRRAWADRTGKEKVRPAPRVLFVLSDEPLITCGRGTFIDDIITAAGGVNVFADVSGYPKVSEEQVLTRSVDVIVCVEHVGGTGAAVAAGLKKRPGWERLAAVKAGRVHAVDADLLTRPGPRLVAGLEAVEKLLRE